MLPNDRLGKNRLPVCPRGQIADALEPLATPALADRGGADAETGERGNRSARAWRIPSPCAAEKHYALRIAADIEAEHARPAILSR